MVTRFAAVRVFVMLMTFRLLVGFIIAVWSPYSILSMHPGRPFLDFIPLSIAGLLLVATGTAGYLWCAWDFASIGLSFGPPMLVARGVYGLVRHPMYFSLLLMLIGESLLFKSWRVFGYACVLALLSHAFVMIYEEPSMVKRWGAAYLQYSKEVPRWLPRLRRRS